MIKKIVSLILILCIICSSGIVSFAVAAGEAQITSPADGEWLDPYKTITIKWSKPSSDVSYRITIKNDVTGTFIVQNEKVTGNSYSIKSNTLDFEQRYKIWVGTYNGSSALGHGDSIKININDRLSSQKIYEAADFSYPSNNAEISKDEDLKITWSGDSDLAYQLVVKDMTTGKGVVDEDYLTKTSYTIKKSNLVSDHSYKAWIGTFKKASVEKNHIGSNDVYFSVKDPFISFPEAEITYPSAGDWLDPAKDVTIKWTKPADSLEYCLTIQDDISGAYVVKNEYTGSNSYTVPKYSFTDEQRYKISLITYAGGSKVGSTNSISVNIMNGVYQEAEFSYPTDGMTIDPSEKLNLKFNNTNSDFIYRITVVDEDSGKYILRNEEVSKSGYTVPANTLESGKRYKLWIGTFVPASTEHSAGDGKVIYINTSKNVEIPPQYKEATFSYPYDGATVYSEKKLTLKFNDIDSNLYYRISVLDNDSGKYIIENYLIGGSTYSIPANTLEKGKKYKLWVGTFTDSSTGSYIGSGDVIYIDTEEKIYGEAVFSYPHDGETLDSEKKIALKFSNIDSDLYYRISIKENDSGDYIVENKKISGNSYTIAANTLDYDKGYTLWIGTFTDSSESSSIGKGDTVGISTLEDPEDPEPTVEAKFVSPENGDIIDFENDLVLKWLKSDINTLYSVSVRDLTEDKYIVENKTVSGTSLKIDSTDLKPEHEYKAWIGTYSDTSADKKLIGSGNEVSFETYPEEIEEYVNVHLGVENDILVAKCQVSVNDFNRVGLKVTNSRGDIILDTSYPYKELTYSFNELTLSPGVTYKLEVTVYNSDNEVVDFKSATYTVAKDNDDVYDDVSSSHNNYDAIMYLTKMGVLCGNGSGSFLPDNNITRAEFVKVVCEAFGLSSNSSKKFRDVPDEHWAESYINIASGLGLVNGVNEYDFAPGENVTYSQAAKIITILKNLDAKASMYGGYPMGYVTIAHYNELFNNTNAMSNYIRTEDYYNKNASRGNVAQIVYNALNHDGKDMTPTSFEILDFGDAYKNPSPRQIYDYVLNRIIEREVYQKAPDVLNALMTMIWAENGGKHYNADGSVAKSSTNDYGLCQLNGSKYKDLNWQENANIGVDKYAVAYYACMTESKYLATVNKAVNKGYSLDEARARTAYCMYNGGNGAHSRWIDSPKEQDSNFKSKWDNRTWKQYIENGSSVLPVDNPSGTENLSFDKVLEETAYSYFGHTYESFTPNGTYDAWCVYCATKIARKALEVYGCSGEEINNIVPYEGSTSYLLNFYKKSNRYYSFTSWTNSEKKVSATANVKQLEYIPKVGDFIAVDTDSDTKYPDHTELIVDVDEENLTFITIAGNTSVPTVCYKDYVYNTNKKMWTRKGDSATFVHGFSSPCYPK